MLVLLIDCLYVVFASGKISALLVASLLFAQYGGLCFRSRPASKAWTVADEAGIEMGFSRYRTL